MTNYHSKKDPAPKYYQKNNQDTASHSNVHELYLKHKRRRNMWLATLVFLLIALGFAFMYFYVWQYSEETDDAYVSGYPVQITSQIPGTVSDVLVKDTQQVKANELLVSLNNDDAQLAYNSALDGLRLAIRQYYQQVAATHQTNALVDAKKTALQNATSAYHRRLKLRGSSAISAEELERAKTLMQSAQADLQAAQAQQQAAKAVLGNTPLSKQPTVLTAISQIKQAWLNLQRTHIYSPVSGQIAKRNVEIGQKIGPGIPLMAVIPLHQLWVEANFKETQLAHIRIGQPVIMHSDLYGDDVTFHGKVIGMSAGTGSAFSLLPAQNATGNWIKVVQRVPVRIQLNEEELIKHPLRIGLSMNVEINTKNRKGDEIIKNSELPTPPIGKVSNIDFSSVNSVINQILKETK